MSTRSPLGCLIAIFILGIKGTCPLGGHKIALLSLAFKSFTLYSGMVATLVGIVNAFSSTFLANFSLLRFRQKSTRFKAPRPTFTNCEKFFPAPRVVSLQVAIS